MGAGKMERETNFVFLAEFFVERCAHDGTADAGRGGEVGFARLAPRGV